MNRERIGPLEVETSSDGVRLRGQDGEVVYIPTRDLHVMGTLLQQQAVNAKLSATSDPFHEPKPSRRLSVDGDVLTGR